jgi:hypothetical protein
MDTDFRKAKDGKKACAPASESGEQDLLKKNQERLALYQKHPPYQETP